MSYALISLTLITLISSCNARLNWTKPGLSWANWNYVPIAGFTAAGSKISSYYTWGPTPVSPPPNPPNPKLYEYNKIPFIPMLWGCTDTYTGPFQDMVNRNFNNANLTSDRAILGFNEPDLKGQADCDPATAARVWKQYLEPLRKKGYRVGSPAVTTGGKKWMTDWFAACNGGCNPDFIAMHWYDLDAGDFISQVKDYHQTWNKPIWVTEYAVQNFSYYDPQTNSWGKQASELQIQIFLDVTTAWMEGVDCVERYFWFGAMYEMQGVNPFCGLLEWSGAAKRTGALNALGVQYAGANGSVSIDPAQTSSARSNSYPTETTLIVIGIACTTLLAVYISSI